MNVAGIKLAFSDTGGSAGRLRFPLISCAKDWDTLTETNIRIRASFRGGALHGPFGCACSCSGRLEGQENLVADDSEGDLSCCSGEVGLRPDGARRLCDKGIRNRERAYFAMQPMPQFETTWQSDFQSLRRQVEDVESDFIFEYSALDEFLSIVEEITKSEPRLFRRVNFPESLDGESRDFSLALITRCKIVRIFPRRMVMTARLTLLSVLQSLLSDCKKSSPAAWI